jgi:hypothetical protein
MTGLDPETSVAGALERVLLAETASPSAFNYDPGESLLAMRYMRQVIENRLRMGHRYGAPVGAKTEIDVISVGSQFEGFGRYPKLKPGVAKTVRESVHIANSPKDRRSADYQLFISHAILAATEAAPPAGVTIPPNVVAWKTKDAASPGPDYLLVATVQGNDFYAVTKPRPPKSKPHH